MSQSLSERNIISCYHRSKSSVWSRIASVNSRATICNGALTRSAADEAVLYPAVGKALGIPQATTPMSRDHVEVSRLPEKLRILRSRIFQPDFDRVTATELRRLLYGLYSVVKLHFAKEKEIYLPILDNHLSEGDAHELFHKFRNRPPRGTSPSSLRPTRRRL